MKQLTPPDIAKVFALTSCSVLSVLAVAPAQAVVMTFESLAVNNTVFNEVASSITENGFNITETASIVGTQSPRYTVYGTQSGQYLAAVGSGGSTAIFSDSNGTNTRGITRLTKVGGGEFNLSSIALNTIFGTGFSLQVNFVGAKADNSTVSQTFGLDSLLETFETFNFNNNFTNLVSVDWQQTLTGYQFDNINVSAVGGGTTAVPEPFTIIGTLVGGTAAFRMRTKLKLAKK